MSLLLAAMPGAPSSFLLLVVRPGAPSSVLAPSSDGLHPRRDMPVIARIFGFSLERKTLSSSRHSTALFRTSSMLSFARMVTTQGLR